MLMTYRGLRAKLQHAQQVCESFVVAIDHLDKQFINHTPLVEERMVEELEQSLVALQAAVKEVATWKYTPSFPERTSPSEHTTPVLA